jgi:hypothetical protein
VLLGHECIHLPFLFHCAVATARRSFACCPFQFLTLLHSLFVGGLVCVILFLFVAADFFFPEANVIYLETPAGVGYSYSADAAYYQGVDDKMTGID